MKSIIDQLYEYIEKTYEFNEPFLLKRVIRCVSEC